MTRIKKVIARLVIAVAAVTILQVVAFKFFNPPFTVNMVYEKAIAAHQNMPFKPRSYKWKDLEQISVYLQQAVLASEDQRFMRYHGFDFRGNKTCPGRHHYPQRLPGASTPSPCRRPASPFSTLKLHIRQKNCRSLVHGHD